MTPKTLGIVALAFALTGVAIWQFALKPATAQSTKTRLPYDNATSVARGETLYANNCASCHGANLQGEPNWKTRNDDGLMPAPPHDVTGHTWHHPDSVLFAITKLGTEAVVGQGYESNMPGFGDSLSDQDILDALGYIKSKWPAQIIARHDAMNAQQN